jgi:eukaryotic-like serine/threonine-protein kinase
MVNVPAVAGDSWDVAKKALLDAGFTLTYNHSADIIPTAVTVTGTDPKGGTSIPKGSNVTVHFKGLKG